MKLQAALIFSRVYRSKPFGRVHSIELKWPDAYPIVFTISLLFLYYLYGSPCKGKKCEYLLTLTSYARSGEICTISDRLSVLINDNVLVLLNKLA